MYVVTLAHAHMCARTLSFDGVRPHISAEAPESCKLMWHATSPLRGVLPKLEVGNCGKDGLGPGSILPCS